MTYNETDTCWHLLVRTEGGTVSMLKNLDAPTARQAYRRLRPETRPELHFNVPDGGFAWSGGCYSVNDSRVRSVDILGPEGCELEPWRGVEPIYYDCSRREPHSGRPMRMQPEEGRKLAAAEDAAQEKAR